MRIALRGNRTLTELRTHLDEMFKRLERMGAVQTRGAFLYLNLLDAEGIKLVPLSTEGEPLELVEIPADLVSGTTEPPLHPAQESSGTVVPFPRK